MGSVDGWRAHICGSEVPFASGDDVSLLAGFPYMRHMRTTSRSETEEQALLRAKFDGYPG